MLKKATATKKRPKKQYIIMYLFVRAAHFFVHFVAIVQHDYNVKLTSQMFYGENVVYAPVRFFFSLLPLIFTLVAARISHFLTAAIKVSCFSSKEIRLLCFLSLALALSLLSTSVQTIKFNRKTKKKLGFVVVFPLTL